MPDGIIIKSVDSGSKSSTHADIPFLVYSLIWLLYLSMSKCSISIPVTQSYLTDMGGFNNENDYNFLLSAHLANFIPVSYTVTRDRGL